MANASLAEWHAAMLFAGSRSNKTYDFQYVNAIPANTGKGTGKKLPPLPPLTGRHPAMTVKTP